MIPTPRAAMNSARNCCRGLRCGEFAVYTLSNDGTDRSRATPAKRVFFIRNTPNIGLAALRLSMTMQTLA